MRICWAICRLVLGGEQLFHLHQTTTEMVMLAADWSWVETCQKGKITSREKAENNTLWCRGKADDLAGWRDTIKCASQGFRRTSVSA